MTPKTATGLDILVIGSGMAGASIAYELALRHRVTVIERESSGDHHSTGRSAAMYLSGYGNASVRALTRASRPFLDSPPAGFVDQPLLRQRGLLTIATAEDAERLQGAEYDGQAWLATAAALALVPVIRPEAFAAARYDADAADIDVNLLHRGFLRGAQQRGAVVVTKRAIRGASAVGDRWVVATDDGPLTADIIVNAAGAWADHVGALFGAQSAGLTPLRRTIILIDQPEPGIADKWPLTMTANESVYFKPQSGQLVISPADETPSEPGDVQPDEWDVAVAIDRFEGICDVPVRRLAHRWAGLRTFAGDRAPVVGPDATVPGLFWFAGQGGYGIQMAPALAAVGAALIDGRPMPEKLAELSFDLDTIQPGRIGQIPPKNAVPTPA